MNKLSNSSEDNINFKIDESDLKKILQYFIRNIRPGEILEKINPKLKILYDNRCLQYENQEFSNQSIKIPKDKMNFEERLLTALLSETNMKNDLNELLEYFYNLFYRVKSVNEKRKDFIEKNEDDILQIVLKRGLINFYSSKIKLYMEEEYEEVEIIKEPVKMTEEEIRKGIEELESHPMFMTEIPENSENNVHLQALQALRFEGKPEDIAVEFLEKSKECFEKYKKSNKFIDLKQSMIQVCDAIDHVKDDSTVPDQIKYEIYFFRSQLQIFVKNMGYAINDLKSALFYIQNDDAYLLLIECYLSLDSHEKALKIITQRKKKLIELELPESKTKLKLYEIEEQKIKSIQKELLSKLQKLESFKNMENKEKLKLYDILTKRGIKLKPQIHNIPQNVEAKIYVDEDNKLHFPALIVYEEFNTTDYIQDLEENSYVSDMLDILFSDQQYLPFDKEHKYSTNTCICYYEVSELDPVLKTEINYYYPLRNDDRLIDILTKQKIYMNGFPVFMIVSSISSHFQDFLKKKTIIKRNNILK